MLHPKAAEYIFFSSALGTFSRVDHILGHKSSLDKLKKNEIMSSIFLDLPKLDWSYDDYEMYQREAGKSFANGVCVAVEDQTAGGNAQLGDRVAFYKASAAGKKVGTNAYDYSAQKFQTEYLREGYKTVRAFRLLPGAEAWYQQIQASTDVNLLQQNLGVANYYDCWRTSKALMKNCGTW